ncbi:GDSL esterase/lipase, partial [Striga asiatica]
MAFASTIFSIRLFLVLFSFASYKATARSFLERKSESKPISAVLIFGDSTVDPGNNNYINTLFKSNFSPYGKDFANQTATGSIEELMTGVSFASAGSGYDPLTPIIS